MTWFRIDDSWWRHPKVQVSGLSLAACGLWAKAGAWCGDQLTDGAVPFAVVRMLGGSPRHAKELVTVGLWIKTSTGYQFHDWLTLQPSRAAVLKKRKETKRRVDEHRDRKKEAQETQDVTPLPGDYETPSVTYPVRSPRPGPARPEPPFGVGVDPTLTRSSPPAGPETPPRREPGRAVGVRPELTRELLPAQLNATQWEPDPEFAIYASELGIEFLEFESIVIELKDQNRRRPHDAGWWELTLCKFLESRQRARSERLAKGGDVESLEDHAARVELLRTKEARG